MRAQEDAPFAAFDLRMQHFLPVKFHGKALELAAQQVETIQNRRGKTMKMAEQMPPVRCMAAHAIQVFVGGSAGRVCGDYEIKCDRVQKKSCCPTPDVHCDPGDYAQRSGCAALWQGRPTVRRQAFSPKNFRSHLYVRFFVRIWRR